MTAPADTGNLRIVALAGQVGSGKSTVARALSEALGFELLRSRMYIERCLTLLEIAINDHTMQRAGHFIVETIGGFELTQRVLQLRKSERIVYDSFRNIQEVRMMRELYGRSFQLVFLDVSPEIRQVRFQNRNDRANSVDDFERRASHPVEAEVQDLRALSNIILDDKTTDYIAPLLAHFKREWGLE